MFLHTPFELKPTKASIDAKKRLESSKWAHLNYDEKQKMYQRLYWSAKRKGKDVSKLPLPRTFIRTQTAGLGGGIAPIPGVALPILDMPGGAEVASSEPDLNNALDAIEVVQSDLDAPSDDESEGKDITVPRVNITGIPEERREFISRYKYSGGVKGERAKYNADARKYGNKLVQGAVLLSTLRNLMANVRSNQLSVSGSAIDIQNLTNRIWANSDNEFRQNILTAFNASGIYFADSADLPGNRRGVNTLDRAHAISNQIMERNPRVYTILHNQIISLFQQESPPSDRGRFRMADIGAIDPASSSENVNVPIRELPGIRDDIGLTLIRNGVHSEVANLFTDRLLDRMELLTAHNISVFEGIDAGRAESKEIMNTYLETIVDELSKAHDIPEINLHNIGKAILSIMFHGKSAISEVLNMTSKQKVDVLKKLGDELTRSANPEKDLPDFERLHGKRDFVNREILGGAIDRSIKQGTRPRPSNLMFDPALFEVGGSLEGKENPRRNSGSLPSIMSPDPESATGNVIINSASGIAKVLRNWGNSNDIARFRRWRVWRNPPDPDEPDGNSTITIITPFGGRTFSEKNFIKALVILGVSGETIRRIIKSITGDKNKSSFDIKSGQKDKPPDITIDIIPKGEKDMFKKLPPNKVPSHFISATQATHLGLTDQMKDIGLSQEFDDYNQLVDEYNKAKPEDRGDIKKFMDVKFGEISNTIQMQTRPDDYKIVPDKTNIKLPPVEIGDDFFAKSNTSFGDVPLTRRTGMAKPWKLTEELRDLGLKPTVDKYNKYVKNFNDSATKGDKFGQGHWKAKMDNLKFDIESAYPTDAQGLKPPGELAVFDRQRENADDLQNLRQAIASKQPPNVIRDLRAKFDESSAQSKQTSASQKAIGTPKTYLQDVRKERFPRTPAETRAFNELQAYEKILHTQVNPNDKSNQALRDYNEFLNASNIGNTGDNGGTNEDYYKFRKNGIRALFDKYKMPDDISSIVTDEEEGDAEDEDASTHPLPGEDDAEEETTAKIEDFEQPMRYIGGEALELISDNRERAEEQKRWDDYSLVKRGFGNGPQNPLYLETLRHDQRRFGPLPMPYRTHPPVRAPARKPQNDTRFENIYSFDTEFEDEYDNTCFPAFTPEYITSNRQAEFENDHSIYFPEHCLRRFKSKPTRIPRMRTDGQRFAPSGYKYGESDQSRNGATGPGTDGVVSDAIPYNNAYGFQQKRNLSAIEYQMARK